MLQPSEPAVEEISKCNAPLISCGALILEQEQGISCMNLGQYRYYLTIWHLTNPIGVRLKELYCM